jgi:hypothetical protein
VTRRQIAVGLMLFISSECKCGSNLADHRTAVRLFDLAEAEPESVAVLVNNASGRLADTFTTDARDQCSRGRLRMSSETFER